MESELVAPATPIESAPPTADTPPTPTPELSVAEHEAQFGAKKAATDEPPVERPRHRAQSQKAGPADVPRIAELTKKLREAERERDEWKAKHSAAPVARDPERPAAMPAAPERVPAPTGKPTMKAFEDQVGTKFDTYAEAIEAYAEARDDWRQEQTKQATQTAELERTHQAVLTGYVEKARAFAGTTPDFFEKTQAAAADFDASSQLLQAAVITHDNGPEIAYYLATHPDVLVDLSLMTDGKPVTQQSVALLQRRLSNYRAQAAVTGSAAPVIPRTPAPRPPNPVRTSAMKPSDEPPGDDASVAEHERYYGKKRR